MSERIDHALVHQLDLCVLAYQLYNQSLIFSLDPWYERWARPGSDRRNNLMAALHQTAEQHRTAEQHSKGMFWGPGSVPGRGWPTNVELDPILTDYRLIDPWRPALTYDGEGYRLFPPAPFAAQIGRAYMASYRPDRSVQLDLVASNPALSNPALSNPALSNPAPSNPALGNAPLGTGDLYAFEGATGGVKDRPPAWSLMGVALAEPRDDRSYDLHIVYRGSQSGWAIRSALWGFVFEAGNADWVTDMEAIRLVADQRVARSGRAVEGFRNAVVESVASLGACLAHLHAERGAPASIQLTGHSLGGGLAIQLAAGLTIGTMVSALPTPVQSWPWSQLQLTTFGAPKALDDTAAAEFERSVDAGRVWLDGDPIVGGPLHAHVGAEIELRLDGVSGGDSHRPEKIWEALTGTVGGQWESYSELLAAIQAGVDRGFSLAQMVSPRFVDDVDLLIEAGSSSIRDRSSYRIGFTKSTTELAERAARLREVFAGSPQSVAELEALLTRLPGVQPDSDLEGHLQQVLTVREVIRNDWTHAQVAHMLGSTVSS